MVGVYCQRQFPAFKRQWGGLALYSVLGNS